MLTIDFNEIDGVIVFTPETPWDSRMIEIDGVCKCENYEYDVEETDDGRGLALSIPIFIHNFESIREIIVDASQDEGIEFTDSAREIFTWVRKLLLTEDTCRSELSEEELQSKLDAAGWNSDNRSLSDFQMRNLVQTSRRDNAAIFSVPGAGKTVEALAYSAVLGGPDVRLVVVCPRNAYIAWENELEACLNIPKNQILRATGTDDELRGKLMVRKTGVRAVLLNYNRLHYRYRFFSEYVRWLKQNNHTVVTVFDESHWFKGGRAFTSAVKRVSPFASHRILLSGTPMPKEPKDLVHQFQALLPYMMGDVSEENVQEISQERFVRTTKNDLGLKNVIIKDIYLDMDTLQAELYQIITDFFAGEEATNSNLRALSKLGDVRKILTYLNMHVSNPTLKRDLLAEIFRNANPELHDRIMGLKSTLTDYGPKIRFACNRARELAADGKKVIIWSTFVNNVELIASELEDIGALYIRGDVRTEEFDPKSYYLNQNVSEEEESTREKRIHKFKTSDDCMVLVANPAAAGEGISLHDVCHHAIYVDRNFDAREFMQSMDRIHRYGKDQDGEIICEKYETTIEILRCNKSIDQAIDKNLKRKMTAMYKWLNDDSLSPNLQIFIPDITDEDIEAVFYNDKENE